MKLQLLLSIAISLIFLANMATATEFKSMDIETSIRGDNTVRNSLTITLDEPLIRLVYPLNFRIFNLTSSNNFGRSDCSIQNTGRVSSILCDFEGMSKNNTLIRLEFDTTSDVVASETKSQYTTNYFAVLPVKRLSATIRLPEGGLLSELIANQSYFPEDAAVSTDGRYIILKWGRSNIKAGESMIFSISYSVINSSALFNTLVMVFVVAIAVIFVGFLFVYKRKSASKPQEVVMSVLDSEEKIIFDILNKYEGKANQKSLVRESNFSKAKVSRLIKSLKDRGVVEIEPISGRENRVLLKTKA